MSDKSIANIVKRFIDQGGDKVWKVSDFGDLSFAAVSQALSRLVKSGFIMRISKGIYYKPHKTVFGESIPDPQDLQKIAEQKNPFYYSGIMAAHFLGFTTQVPKRRFISTSASSLPQKMLGKGISVRTRRPFVWRSLNQKEVAILEFLRGGGHESDLGQEETLQKLITLLKTDACYEHLVGVSPFEPPRIRALLGALGEEIKAPLHLTQSLRSSLNPLSRFDFGIFNILPNAKDWQAKGTKNHVSV